MSCNTCNKKILTPKLKDIPKGAIAIVRNILGINVAKSQIISQRLSICMNCSKLNKGVINQCSLCNCAVEQKARQQSETCPINLWVV